MLAEGAIVLVLSGVTQYLDCRCLDDHETCQGYLLAERHGQRDQAAEGMTDQMDATSGPANDRLQHLGLVCEIEGLLAVRRSAVPPYPSRLVVTQRNRLFHAAITGRHAAPVLHDPGTSTTVGPVPHSS